MMRSKARKLRELIERGARSLTDSEALTGIELYPAWREGISYKEGERIRYEGTLYKVVQAHTSQVDWSPDSTPALYTEVAPAGVIPVWVQPSGAHDAYMIGDKVRYPDEHGPVYESVVNNNTWSPEAYPAGWLMI